MGRPSLRTKLLAEEFIEKYPNRKLYGVPNDIFLDIHNRFPFKHHTFLFFGKDKTMETASDYISITPLVKEGEDSPSDDNCNYIYADDIS